MTTRKTLEGALADWHPHPKDDASLAPDNASLAPVVRDAAASDEIADRFFDSAPEATTAEPPIAVAAEPAARLVAIDSAAVRARRRYLMRYVAGAVSVAGVIGLAAIVRMTMAGDASAADTPRTESAIAASLPVAPPPAVAAADTIAPQAAPPPPADPVVPPSEPAADPSPPVAPAADPPAAAAPPPADVAPETTQTAGDAKKEALRALERGHLADSIKAGEQSVALDPGDADAWLILGAAYQQQGRSADARRCFTTCAAKAERGPRGECRALLH